MNTYDRYSKFRGNGTIKIVPNIEIPKLSSDYYEVYNRGKSRLDNISYEYYKDPNYDWLIMMANPEYGSMEFEIPDGSQLRIPYPLDTILQAYNLLVDNYNRLYK